MLPYIEQSALYARWKFQCPAHPGINRVLAWPARIQTFICPSDRVEQGFGQTNYAWSLGPNLGWNDDDRMNGIFRWNHEVGMSDVTDGLSNTIMLGEKLLGDGNDGKNSVTDTVMNVPLPSPFSDPFPTQAQVDTWGQAAVAAWSNHYSPSCDSFSWSSSLARFNEIAPPNWIYPDIQVPGCQMPRPWWRPAWDGARCARSHHPGGVNVALGDASVHFVSNTIDLPTWQGLGSRNGGESVQAP